MESQVTDIVENTLDDIYGVSDITSTSSNGSVTLVVQFNQDENIDDKVDEVQRKINKIKSKLPSDSQDFQVSDFNLSEQPIFAFTIATNQNKFLLKKTLDDLNDDFSDIEGVSKVDISGLPEQEISIFLDTLKMKLYNISFSEISNAIRSSNISYPLGEIDIKNQTYILSSNGEIENIKDLENVIIKNNNNKNILLSDISKITKGFKDQKINSSIIFAGETEAQRSVTFSISKNPGFNILEITDSLKEKLESVSQEGEMLDKIPYVIIMDLGEDAKKDIYDLSANGLAAVVLVFFILIFVLGVKDSFIAAIGIPLSFLLSFIFFLAVGNTLNFISLFSMILSIGILVDSDIVITEGIAKKKEWLKKNKPELESEALNQQASELAIRNLAGPMIAGTMTTVAVFAPLFFLSGVTGDFIKNIPYTIVFILLASQIISIFVIPLLHSTKFRFPFSELFKKIFRIKENKTKKSFSIKKVDFSKIEKKYKNILRYFLEKRYRQNIMFLFVFVFFVSTLLLPILGVIKSEFFPSGDIPLLYINVELDKGSLNKDMDAYLGGLKDILVEEKFYSSILLTKGRTSQYDHSGSTFGERYGNVLINLKTEEKSNGKIHIEKIRNKIKKSGFDKVVVSAPQGGPPSGSPIEFDVLSENTSDLRESTLLAEDILKSIPGVINVKSQLDKNNTGLEILIDKQKAFYHKISSADVSKKILSITKGVEVFELKEDKQKTKVYLKIVKSQDSARMERITPEDILNTTIKNRLGDDIYISTFSKVVPKSIDSSIFHLNKKNSLKITAENKEGALVVDIISKLKKDFLEKSKNNSKLSFGGASAEQHESFGETAAAFGIGIAIIFGILIFLFNSIKLPLIIESVIPFAFSGVIIGLFVSGNSISFPAILGFIALSGIIVNNSIILMYIYEEKRKNTVGNKNRILSKDEIGEIVTEGSAERLRPIILTTITTIAGMTPLVFSSAT